MRSAESSRRELAETKMLVLSAQGEVRHERVKDLLAEFGPGDLIVVNRSGTLPASLRGTVGAGGPALELRLAASQSGPDLREWIAFAFGAGDWRIPTEERGAPPPVAVGDTLVFDGLEAHVGEVAAGRLLRIRFTPPADGDLVTALYRAGKPIQYSYLREELCVWDQQTIFAGPPLSVEPPSAGFPLTWELVLALRARGVRLASLLHGAGISSTGSPALDALLPLREWYEVPARTATLVNRARTQGKRVLAVGTTVLRALESAVRDGRVTADQGLTSLRIAPSSRIHAVTDLLTGMHEPGTSHLDIVGAFAGRAVLNQGYAEAEARGYRGHEYGDVSLVRSW